MDSILMQLTQAGLAFSFLVAAVLYLKGQIKKKEKEIEALQLKVITDQRENLTLLYKVVAFMEKGDENFSDLKIFISDKIDSLK